MDSASAYSGTDIVTDISSDDIDDMNSEELLRKAAEMASQNEFLSTELEVRKMNEKSVEKVEL